MNYDSIGVSRRRFGQLLVTLAGSAAVGHVAGADAGQNETPEAKGLVGSHIYGWGQYAERAGQKVDVPGVISALKEAGYDYLEKGMDFAKPEDFAQFAAQLKAGGLQPVSVYTGGRMHEPDAARITTARLIKGARACYEAGFRIVTCNPDPIGRAKTDEELKVQSAALAEIGAAFKAEGLALAIHQHLPELANQAHEFHYVFDHTKPQEVGWCLDVHWVFKGGFDPLAALREYGNRLHTWHLRQSRNNVWWETLDSGDVDYPAIAAYARAHRLPRRFSVELALEKGTRITRSVQENHRLAREYVRKVFGI